MTRFSSFKNSKSKKSLTAFQNLIIQKPPWAKFTPENWSGTTWLDSSGNNHHATTSGVSFNTSSNVFGASGNISFLSGNTTNTINFGTGSIPANFCIASLTRCTGTTGRLLKGLASNWVHGHLDVTRGAVYYSGYKNATGYGVFNNWLNCIGTNYTSVINPNNILIDNVPVGGSPNGGSGSDVLVINVLGGQSAQVSQFAISQLLIWDVMLTAAEMVIISNAISTYMTTGILQ